MDENNGFISHKPMHFNILCKQIQDCSSINLNNGILGSKRKCDEDLPTNAKLGKFDGDHDDCTSCTNDAFNVTQPKMKMFAIVYFAINSHVN